MDEVTKPIYREYLCTRLKDLARNLDDPHVPVKTRQELQRDTDYIMQQLYLLDNETEE